MMAAAFEVRYGIMTGLALRPLIEAVTTT